MDEEAFLKANYNSINIQEFNKVHDRQSSLLAQMIILNRVLMEINDFHHEVIKNSLDQTIIEIMVQNLSSKLDNWQSNLPEYMHDTLENLHRYSSKNLGRIFVAVHLGYYHFGQLLFYGFLQEDGLLTSDTSSLAHTYATKCKSYAGRLCDIVYSASRTPGCNVLYTSAGANIVIASTVQIHTLLFSSSEDEICSARLRLERNFAILTEMRTHWPVLEVSFARFRTFREECRKNMDTAFRMDEWILRFLYGLAQPIEERPSYHEAEGKEGWLERGRNIWIGPGDWI